jgi:hypothetical protein
MADRGITNKHPVPAAAQSGVPAMNSSPANPSSFGASARAAAATLLWIHGVLVLLDAFFGPRSTEAAVGGAVVLSVLHFGIVLAVAVGLSRGRRWAWWGAVALALVGLFFLLPLAMGVLFGSGPRFSQDKWELALVLGSPTVLAAVLALLTTQRRAWEAQSIAGAADARDRH